MEAIILPTTGGDFLRLASNLKISEEIGLAGKPDLPIGGYSDMVTLLPRREPAGLSCFSLQIKFAFSRHVANPVTILTVKRKAVAYQRY